MLTIFNFIFLQTPHNQAGILDTRKYPEYVCLGGGFGPVSLTFCTFFLTVLLIIEIFYSTM